MKQTCTFYLLQTQAAVGSSLDDSDAALVQLAPAISVIKAEPLIRRDSGLVLVADMLTGFATTG